MRTTGKFAAAILSAIMMANGLSLPMAYAAPSSRYVSVDEKYDPFAEEEMPAKEADPSKLTFKERLALQKKEEQAAAQKVTIANVLPGHIYIPKKTMLNVELIGKTVKNAVKKALAKQSGLTPAKQHDVFRRLKRFDIKPGDMWQAYSAQDAAVVKPEYLLAAERLAKEDIMLVYTSLYAHLLDQHLWELISSKEMQLAGQKLLQVIAEQYNVEAEIINEGTLASMLASWQQQFNKIIAQRLHPTAKES